MALIERPYVNSFSKNDIRYVFQLADIDRSDLYLQVKVLYAALSDTEFTELYTFDLKPDSNGYVYLYLQGYLDSLTKFVLPTIGDMSTGADAQAQKFYIEYREISDDDVDPDFVTTESDHIRYVIKGGIEKNKFSRNNFFINYLETQKKFLTWRPASHFIFYDEKMYLSFYNSVISENNLSLEITATDINGDTGASSTNFSAVNFLYHLNVSPGALDVQSLVDAKLWYYEISIKDVTTDAVIVNAYRIYIEYRPAYKFYDLIYFNSISGIDTVRVIGETDINISRGFDETEGGIKLNWQDAVNTFETSHINIRLARKYKGDIGFLRNRSRSEQEAFIELLASINIYQQIDSRWIPVINLQQSVEIGKTTDTRQSFPVEWSLSESNEVFTPEKNSFGAGTDTETY